MKEIKDKERIIKTGQEVLRTEANAVRALVDKLGENFAQAVELLTQTKSRVIITGMGKSGIIGRKIASTLTSCGTPAFFVHPAEAGHGELGIILKNDVIIAISSSGETKEIIGLLDFIKRIGIKLICITGNTNSSLARFSDIVLNAGVEKEAGRDGVVPTASSTASLALGDALAIAVMEKKGLGVDDFAFAHPKGMLGKKLLKVENLMHREREIPKVLAATPMKDVLEEMTSKKLGVTCIVDSEERLIGIITDGDLRRMLMKYGNKILEKTARDCMTPDPITIDKDDLATKALNLMEKNKITSLIIKNSEEKIEGIIHLHDLWRTEMF
ncbi:MAG: SIS domain-containing protein [Candidatus Aminicenantales bacterium]